MGRKAKVTAKTDKISFRLPEGIRKDLEQKAELANTGLSEYVRQCLTGLAPCAYERIRQATSALHAAQVNRQGDPWALLASCESTLIEILSDLPPST